MLPLVVALISVLLSGCGDSSSQKADAARYYFNVARAGWDTVIYINGNPAARGGSAVSMFQEMSPWMKKGSNSIRITTKRLSDSPFARDTCDIRFVEMTDPTDPDSVETLGGIYESPPDADEYEVEFEVTSESGIVWLWERADALDGLTDADRKGIEDLLAKLADGLRKKDLDVVSRCFAMPWGSGPPPESVVSPKMSQKEIDAQQREFLGKIFAYPDLTVTALDPGERELIVGTQAVMVCAKPVRDPAVDSYVIYAGHGPDYEAPSGEMSWSISYEQLHFLKVDEKWVMLAN